MQFLNLFFLVVFRCTFHWMRIVDLILLNMILTGNDGTGAALNGAGKKAVCVWGGGFKWHPSSFTW